MRNIFHLPCFVFLIYIRRILGQDFQGVVLKSVNPIADTYLTCNWLDYHQLQNKTSELYSYEVTLRKCSESNLVKKDETAKLAWNQPKKYTFLGVIPNTCYSIRVRRLSDNEEDQEDFTPPLEITSLLGPIAAPRDFYASWTEANDEKGGGALVTSWRVDDDVMKKQTGATFFIELCVMKAENVEDFSKVNQEYLKFYEQQGKVGSGTYAPPYTAPSLEDKIHCFVIDESNNLENLRGKSLEYAQFKSYPYLGVKVKGAIRLKAKIPHNNFPAKSYTLSSLFSKEVAEFLVQNPSKNTNPFSKYVIIAIIAVLSAVIIISVFIWRKCCRKRSRTTPVRPRPKDASLEANKKKTLEPLIPGDEINKKDNGYSPTELHGDFDDCSSSLKDERINKCNPNSKINPRV